MFLISRRPFLKSVFVIFIFTFSYKHLSSDSYYKTNSTPVLLIAREVSYDQQFGVIKAWGHVEAEHEGRVLYADQLQYNKLTDQIFARGHVRIHEASGEIVFLDQAELKGDLKSGLVHEIKMILTDQSRLIASRARRDRNHSSVFNNVVYSPCRTCRAQPNKPPLWQIKAREVIWDEHQQDIIYTDASMELAGIPFLYTPYLSHPAPNVKRRSGFLSPFFGGSANYGLLLGMPYFWVIDQNSDMTITPTVAGNRPMLELEYRQRFTKGRLHLTGSITDGDRTAGTTAQPVYQHNRIRGHIVGEGLFDINRHWRTGFSLERATDQTYLKKFKHLNMSSKNVLITKGYLEGFKDRSYTGIQAYTFQGLHQNDISATTPIVLPNTEIDYISRPDSHGSVWTFNANALGLLRREGTNMQRLSGTAGWYIPYYDAAGYVITSGIKARADYYHVSNYQYQTLSATPAVNRSFTGNISRGFAQIYTNFNWPFIKAQKNTRYIIEPRVGLVLGPNVGSSQKLPNEDTRVVELNDLNLFSENRLAGLDRIDSGTRLNYGFNVAAYNRKLGHADLFIGQSYSFIKSRDFLVNTGIDDNFSDYTGRLKITYNDWLILRSNVLIDHKKFSCKRTEIRATIGKPVLNAHVDYILLPRLTMDPLGQNGEQIRLTINAKLTNHWSKTIGFTRGLGKMGGALSQEIGLQYQDECLVFSTLLQKTFYSDRDVKPGLSLMFRIVFKTLGTIEYTNGLDQ